MHSLNRNCSHQFPPKAIASGIVLKRSAFMYIWGMHHFYSTDMWHRYFHTKIVSWDYWISTKSSRHNTARCVFQPCLFTSKNSKILILCAFRKSGYFVISKFILNSLLFMSLQRFQSLRYFIAGLETVNSMSCIFTFNCESLMYTYFLKSSDFSLRLLGLVLLVHP